MQVGAVYLVDGAGQTAGWTHRSIDAAASVALPGATIRVVGLTDGAGNPVAYSDSPVVFAPGQPAEGFPIDLKTGVTLESYDPTIPVYVWSTSTSGTATLIDVVESPYNTDDIGPTRIEGLRLAAAGRGIRIHHASADYTVLIKDCWFAHLGDAVDAKATGVTTSVAIRNCQIRDDNLPYSAQAIPPAPVAESRGILLQAAPGSLSGAVGVLAAEVTSLTTSGTFGGMAPVDWDIDMLDLAGSYGATATRLIEAYGHFARSDEYPNIASPTDTYQRSQICEVQLTVNGGLLDGRASAGSSNGWDVGLYAHAQGDGDPIGASGELNYNTGFDVTTYGTAFRNFRLAGVVGATYKEGRGTIDLAAGTTVTGTGTGQIPGTNIRNGVHMFAMEGYLALTANGFQSDSNAGHGVWANFWGEHGGTHLVPEGVYLGLQGCGFHGNGRSGIAMETSASTLNRTGAVGGATYNDTFVLAHRVPEHEGFAQLFGPGYINGCAVSNNGGSGIHGHLLGVGYSGTTVPCATLLVRCTNNAIWNNAEGGVTVLLDQPHGSTAGGLCLMPITHCTLVNNGGSGPGGWSVEIDDSATSGGRYEVDNYPYDLTILRTRIFNSVMFRDYANPGSTLKDFGPTLEGTLARFDDNNPGVNPILPNRIGAAGNRAETLLKNDPLVVAAWQWTDENPAFIGPVALGSWDVGPFHLDSAAGTTGYFRNSTPDYLNAFAPESGFDVDGEARPAIIPQQHDRDKGFDEIP